MKNLKMLLFLAAFVFIGGLETAAAQDNMSTDKKIKFPSIQKSPTDIAYFRDGRRGPVHAKVVYSRPFKKGRKIFGGIVRFGKLWRTGADEATEITFYKDVVFGGKEVKAGSYALFTIPNADSWDIILNSGLHQWGAFTYDQTKDVARTKAKPKSMEDSIENFSITFSDGNMIFGWDKTMVAVPVKVK